jgi:GNAT superfamily N-acetyltransferase
MPSAAQLTLRDARPEDRPAITGVLAAAFADSDVGRWLDPDPDTRLPHALAYFRTTVDQAMSGGTVRVADQRGEILAAALWVARPAASASAGDPAACDARLPVGGLPVGAGLSDGPGLSAGAGLSDDAGLSAGAGAVFERLRLLGQLLDERHPHGPAHHHLAYLGVRPDRQRQGIGSYLLIGHHAYLHVAGIPAYLEANDPRSRQLYLRHGYTDVGVPIMLPSGLPIWPMWRPPAPAGAIASASIVPSSDAPLARLARFSIE